MNWIFLLQLAIFSSYTYLLFKIEQAGTLYQRNTLEPKKRLKHYLYLGALMIPYSLSILGGMSLALIAIDSIGDTLGDTQYEPLSKDWNYLVAGIIIASIIFSLLTSRKGTRLKAEEYVGRNLANRSNNGFISIKEADKIFKEALDDNKDEKF